MSKLLKPLTHQSSDFNFKISEPCLTSSFIKQTSLLDLLALARLKTSAQKLKNFTCGLLNVKSGSCSEDCVFCAQSSYYNTESPKYPFLSSAKILTDLAKTANYGFDFVGLASSGQILSETDFERLCQVASMAKDKFNLKLCASIGLLNSKKAAALKKAGFTSYHHNLETAPSYFKQICRTHDYQLSVNSIKIAQDAGLRVCSGGLFGLGENWEERLEFAHFLQELNPDSIPINFLIPIPGTPLANQTLLNIAEALKIIALFRLALPQKDVVICGGRSQVLGPLRNLVFAAGANGAMLGDYLTVKGGSPLDDLNEMSELGVI